MASGLVAEDRAEAGNPVTSPTKRTEARIPDTMPVLSGGMTFIDAFAGSPLSIPAPAPVRNMPSPSLTNDSSQASG
jgi:hypothetical protein